VGAISSIARNSRALSLPIQQQNARAGCLRVRPPRDRRTPWSNASRRWKRIRKAPQQTPGDAETVRLINQGKPGEAERLQLQAAQDDEAAGLARTKKAAERYRGIAATAGLADPKKAREYYAKAAKLDPNNINGMVWHANMEQDAGNLPEAERAYNVVLGAAVKGKNDRWLYWARLGLGDLSMARGTLLGALSVYQQASSDAERHAKADHPSNAQLQRDLSFSCIKVGDVLEAQGALADALKAYGDGLAIAERLAKADPDNAGWRRDLSVAYERVGDVLKAQGALADALKAYRDSLAIAERLAKANPGNAGWQADLAASHGKLGQLYVRMGDKAEARRMFERGRAIVAPFAEKSGHQRWIGSLKAFDKDLAALEK